MVVKINKVKKIIVPPGILELQKILDPLPRYKLGSPPWNEEQLKKAYFRDWQYTENAIKKHSGFEPHQYLEILNLSLEMFNSSVSDLLSSIKTFRLESANNGFWQRPNQNRVSDLESSIRRGVFSTVLSARALIKRSEATKDKFKIREYKEQVNKHLSNEQINNFLKELRNYVAHYQIINTDWQVTRSVGKERQCRFLLKQDELLRWGKWSCSSKAFIKSHPKGIDVELLFENYRKCILKFHEWFHKAIEQVSEPQLSQYRNYEKMLKQFGVRAWCKVLLNEALKRKVDPYEHLDEFLDKSELDEIMQLPKRSTQQIDKIIGILDTFNACNEELRQMVYDFFKCRKKTTSNPKKSAKRR